MLPLHFTLIKRYAPELTMPLFFATEDPENPICKEVEAMGVQIITIDVAESGFLDCRRAALRRLRTSFDYVIPVQEDFLMDRTPSYKHLVEAIQILDEDASVDSVRLTPCPGPGGELYGKTSKWAHIGERDPYAFTFQATMWRTGECLYWYSAICSLLEKEWPVATTPPRKRIEVEIRENFAENAKGQRFFREVCKGVHIGWKRAGPWSNAVYLCPWPYRPTAIVQGKLEGWAAEMFKREGIREFNQGS